MGAEQFHTITYKVGNYLFYGIYGLCAFIGMWALIFSFYKKSTRSLNIVLFTSAVTLYGWTNILFISLFLSKTPKIMFNISVGIAAGVSMLLQWMICLNYLKVSIEAKSLLDPEIILNNANKIKQVDHKKFWL